MATNIPTEGNADGFTDVYHAREAGVPVLVVPEMVHGVALTSLTLSILASVSVLLYLQVLKYASCIYMHPYMTHQSISATHTPSYVTHRCSYVTHQTATLSCDPPLYQTYC